MVAVCSIVIWFAAGDYDIYEWAHKETKAFLVITPYCTITDRYLFAAGRYLLKNRYYVSLAKNLLPTYRYLLVANRD